MAWWRSFPVRHGICTSMVSSIFQRTFVLQGRLLTIHRHCLQAQKEVMAIRCTLPPDVWHSCKAQRHLHLYDLQSTSDPDDPLFLPSAELLHGILLLFPFFFLFKSFCLCIRPVVVVVITTHSHLSHHGTQWTHSLQPSHHATHVCIQHPHFDRR